MIVRNTPWGQETPWMLYRREIYDGMAAEERQAFRELTETEHKLKQIQVED